MHDCFFRFSFILAWPVDLLANYTHLSGLLIELGPDLKMPHSKALGKGLFELRHKAASGIGRAFIVSYRAKRLWSFTQLLRKRQKHQLKIYS
jgi:biotin-(acetyl-CoA carboxylase) ligase